MERIDYMKMSGMNVYGLQARPGHSWIDRMKLAKRSTA